jgi:uncharacterized HAD superfamily protein
VVGIPRSGLLAANLVALALNLPLADLEGFAAGRVFASGHTRRRPGAAPGEARPARALVVDDSVHTGGSIREARELLGQAGLADDAVFCCVYGDVAAASGGLVDILLEPVPQPRIYQWNVMHHAVMADACLDIDGVLCCDPTHEENDDGERYGAFLRDAAPLVLPSWPVGYLVTSRLERYRAQTEAWLARHGVVYGELVMLDLPTAQARRESGSHGRFKGSFYRSCPARLFVESEERQALEIVAVSGKPVLSMETGELLRPDALNPLALAQRARLLRQDGLKRTARTVLGPAAYEALRRALRPMIRRPG